jgi:hypothetical protein
VFYVSEPANPTLTGTTDNARDPRNLKPFGFAFGGLSETWDAYWVPRRTANNHSTKRRTSILYSDPGAHRQVRAGVAPFRRSRSSAVA